jgi:hypothetical protein
MMSTFSVIPCNANAEERTCSYNNKLLLSFARIKRTLFLSVINE